MLNFIGGCVVKKLIFILMFGVLLFSISPGRACLEPETEPRYTTNLVLNANTLDRWSHSIRSISHAGPFMEVDSTTYLFSSRSNELMLAKSAKFNLRKGELLVYRYDINVTLGDVFLALLNKNDEVLHHLSKNYHTKEAVRAEYKERKISKDIDGVSIALMASKNIKGGYCNLKLAWNTFDTKNELKKK